MKKLLPFLIIILIFSACSKDDGSGIVINQLTIDNIDFEFKNVGFPLKDIDFLDENTGFVIDNQGQIQSTNNSGDDWNLLYTTNYELLDIQFLTQQNGFVLAKVKDKQEFFLLKTEDFGLSFQETAIPNGSGLDQIYFINNDIGFALGNHLLRTEDSGLTWTELNLDFNVWGDIIKKNNGELYACGLNGSFFKSVDKGKNWERIDLGIKSHLNQIEPFQDEFYFRGQSIVKTNITDTREFEIPAILTDLHVYKEDVLVGFGHRFPERGFAPEGAIFTSNDSGAKWEVTISKEFITLGKTDFIDANNGFGIANASLLVTIKIND